MTDTKPSSKAPQLDGAGERLLDKVQALSNNPGAALKFLTQGAAMENAAKSSQPTEEAIAFDLLKSYQSKPDPALLAAIATEMSSLSAEQVESVKEVAGPITIIEGAAGVFVLSEVDESNLQEFYAEAMQLISQSRAHQTAEPIPFELGLPAELVATPFEMPLTTSEDRDADWAGLPADSAGLSRFLTASAEDGQGPKGALSWRQVMQDLIQGDASEGSKAPSAEDLSGLLERRRKCLGLADNEEPTTSPQKGAPKP